MNVARLIEELRKMPADAVVVTNDGIEYDVEEVMLRIDGKVVIG